MKRLFLLFVLFITVSCQDRSKPYTIAIDKSFSSIELDGQIANLNGYISDLLLEITKLKKFEVSLIDTSWDNILQNLNGGKYDAIFTTMDPLNYNLSKYDFSKDILKIGNALIVAKNSTYKSLDDMSNTHIGYLSNSKSIYILQKQMGVFLESYHSIPEMLNDIKAMQLEGGVVPIILAYKYVSDLYQNDLKILSPLLDNSSIKIITLKDKNKNFLKIFNSGLDKLSKNKTLEKLKNKWGFYN